MLLIEAPHMNSRLLLKGSPFRHPVSLLGKHTAVALGAIAATRVAKNIDLAIVKQIWWGN